MVLWGCTRHRCFELKANGGMWTWWCVFNLVCLHVSICDKQQSTVDATGYINVFQIFSNKSMELNTIWSDDGTRWKGGQQWNYNSPWGDVYFWGKWKKFIFWHAGGARGKVSGVYPLETMNVCIKFYANPSNSWWDVSVWTKVVHHPSDRPVLRPMEQCC